MKLRFANVKAPCAKVLNLAQSDARVLEYVNQAVERLLYDGMFVGTVIPRYTVCVQEKCLVWPREVETILAAWACTTPLVLRGTFYEALENGPGLSSSDGCGPCLTLIDRGSSITFDWITTTGYKLAIYADGTEAAGARVLIRYYDSNGNKVYTVDGSETIEGEYFTIPSAGAYTVGTFEVLPYGIYEVIKPVTKRVIRLYGKKTSDSSYKPLAYYEPDETIPEYRVSLLSELSNGSCNATQVTISAKSRFIPAIDDNSVLLIQHLGAIKLGCQAVKKEEDNLSDEAIKYWAMAGKALGAQLRHHRGTGQVDPIRFAAPSTFGAGSVRNIV